MKLAFIFTICTIFFLFNTAAQKPSKIQLVQANSIEYNANIGNGVRRLIGNVCFKQDNITMFCDSAYFYNKDNIFDAFSNVHVKMDTSLNIYSTKLHYIGDSKIAQFRNNVILKDNKLTLKTNYMDYDLNDNSGKYFNHGIIIDSSSTLESTWGYYIPDEEVLFFKDSVRVRNEKYIIYTDTIKYNTTTEVVYFFGPTKIVNDTNLLYCENGWYNTKTDIAQFNKDAYYKNKIQKLSGDSLYYDRKRGIGKAFVNVEIFDSVKNIIVKGNYGFYKEKPEQSLITDSALFLQISDSDTLFMHADTLNSRYDTSGVFRILNAFHKAKIYRSDYQAKCDSLMYSIEDSVIHLFYNPILWSDINQITADVIDVYIKDSVVDYFELINNSLVISQEDSIGYNQIKGKNMTGFIDNGELYKIEVRKKGETIYFAKDKKGLIGVNKAKCEDMNIFLENKNVKKIVFLKQPKATLHPIGTLSVKEKLIKGFSWRADEKPNSMEDIFIWP